MHILPWLLLRKKLARIFVPDTVCLGAHVSDLPLSPFAATKVNPGLWNYKIAEVLNKLALFAPGISLCIRNTTAKNKADKMALYTLIMLLLII